jgi:ABC-type uncharacterized transport system auxiliary subunit
VRLNRFGTVALALCSACALFSRGDPVEVRWFTPEHLSVGSNLPPTGPALRISHVTSQSSLGERIAHGNGAYEVSYYETLRWTERPAKYVLSTLERTLFEERGFQKVTGGSAPGLDVDLLSFQEVQTSTTHLARVALRGVLTTDHELFAETFSIDQPIDGTQIEDVVAAISRALDAVVNQLAVRVTAALSKPARAEAGSR